MMLCEFFVSARAPFRASLRAEVLYFCLLKPSKRALESEVDFLPKRATSSEERR